MRIWRYWRRYSRMVGLRMYVCIICLYLHCKFELKNSRSSCMACADDIKVSAISADYDRHCVKLRCGWYVIPIIWGAFISDQHRYRTQNIWCFRVCILRSFRDLARHVHPQVKVSPSTISACVGHFYRSCFDMSNHVKSNDSSLWDLLTPWWLFSYRRLWWFPVIHRYVCLISMHGYARCLSLCALKSFL